MEEQSVREIITATHRVRSFGAAALLALTVFLGVAALNELKSYKYIGSGVAATNTITVSGEGEVFAVPDTATFSVTVQETAKDVSTAQTTATKKSNDIIAYLKTQGIDEKDIQTTDYNVNPQYEYGQTACPSGIYCPPGKQTLSGFEVSQTLTVKVRDTKKAGDILSGVGGKGASSVSGLSFTVADQDALDAEARDKAIQSAKDKADALARSLGVHIVRVVGFSENGNSPIYYAKTTNFAADAGGGAMAAPAPQIPVGQNKITSDVSVVYEIQ
jgi:uncharacterized protein YggE